MTKGGSALAMMRDGERIISSLAAEFFGNVVHDEETRQPEDFCYLARLHEWAGECEQAFAVLAQGRSLYPGYGEIPFQHASFRGRAGEPDAALDDAEQATQLAPWKTQTWELLGQVYGDLGKATHAERARKRAAEVQLTRDQLALEIAAV